MKKQLFVLGMASVFALTGCYGIKKVDFEKFKEEVNKLEDEKQKEVKIGGKLNGEKLDKFTYEIPQSAGGALDSLIDVATGKYSARQLEAIGHLESVGSYAISSSDKLTYYTGMGFKVKSEDKTVEWNAKGLIASYKAGDTSLTFTWKKA